MNVFHDRLVTDASKGAKTLRAALALLPFLTLPACGGGGATSVPLAAPAAATAGTSTDPQSVLLQDAVRSRFWGSGAKDLLYVGNLGNNSITVYNHAASGNSAPMYVIAGPKTGISSPGQLSEDAWGDLYVTNGLANVPGTNPAILVFAHGAHGDVAPIRKLNVAAGFSHMDAMTVDKRTGDLFVFEDANAPGALPDSTLLRYAWNASGNAQPLASRDTGFQAFQAAINAAGQIVDSHSTNGGSFAGFGVETLDRATLRGVADIAFMPALGVAADRISKTLLLSSDYGLYRIDDDATAVGGLSGAPQFTPSPAVISSDTCGAQLAVAPGPTPYTYVTHAVHTPFGSFISQACPADAVYVYANSASGNATPVRILTGPATQMNQPYGIYEGY